MQLYDIPRNFAVMCTGGAAHAAASLGRLPKLVSLFALLQTSEGYPSLHSYHLLPFALGHPFCTWTACIQERNTLATREDVTIEPLGHAKVSCIWKKKVCTNLQQHKSMKMLQHTGDLQYQCVYT